MRYADVVIDISLEKLDRTYQYAIPEHLLHEAVTGAKVLVPFGKGNRKVTGYIMEVSELPNFDSSKTKSILSVEKGAISLFQRTIEMAGFLKQNYGGTMNEAIKTVLPVKKEIKGQKERILSLIVSEERAIAYRKSEVQKNHSAKSMLVTLLLTEKKVNLTDLRAKKISISTINAVKKDGIAELTESILYRNRVPFPEIFEKPVLNSEQKKAVDEILTGRKQNRKESYLLFGVTGSGKTEVYLSVIEQVIKEGKQAIVLIPEIALTYQTIKRFQERLGERVSVLHSKLSQGERYDQYLRAKNGEVDVMIGPRSALFTPFPELSLIIIDEEQEGAYKSEGTPKYHAREAAEFLSAQTGATLLLGSATPSLESFTKALEGKYKLLRLPKRAKDAVMPEVTIVDLRKELSEGNRSMFSRNLQSRMKETLAKGEQIMLFLNRRGYAGAVSCRSCGTVMKCPHCEVSLTFHKEGYLQCHYCGYETRQPSKCPQCGSRYIGLFGTGTQKVEEAVHTLFPEASILRMDADTTKKKDGHDKIIAAFAAGEAQILIGTQMIVKGHDFKNVTLVGILAADLSLYTGDFRSAERTFSLLAQASGRAGRAEKKGYVVIQTYQPDHYSVVTAASEDYETFYRKEIAFRKMTGYPPAGFMLCFLFQSEVELYAKQAAEKMEFFLKEKVKDKKISCLFIGPAKAGVARVKDTYRYVLYGKTYSKEELLMTGAYASEVKEGIEKEFSCNIQFDFDPYNNY